MSSKKRNTPRRDPKDIRGRWLSPRTDITFKRVFGTEENKDITIEMLNTLLEPKIDIADITFPNPAQIPITPDHKEVVFDVYARDESGREYVVEMQVRTSLSLRKRALRYLSGVYASQLKSGEEYRDQKEVQLLLFTEEMMFPSHPSYESTHKILERDTGVCHFEDIGIKCYEGSKFVKMIGELGTLKEKYLYFLFKTDYTLEEIPESIKSEARLMKAYESLERTKWNTADLLAYMDAEDRREGRIEKALLHDRMQEGINLGRQEGINLGRQEGINLGRQEGINLGRQEVISAMLSGGMSIEEIAEVLKVPPLEVQKLIN